ncbi:TrmH family RNA methyltransferase [Kiritimatiellota bacterium B12222]|nr:TrmH family RNA methyltransferase [Kiritimatiellota bacterium B12222]
MQDFKKNIRIVCVRPLFGGNMGAICRAMKNCGLDQLVLVNPSPTMDQIELRKMALKALPIYKQRKEFDSVEEAVADCGAVAMTSGVDGFYRDHASTPRQAAPELIEIAAQKPIAIVFGSEDKGMKTEELKFATHLLRIPSHHDYSSINLSQAVMLVTHELYQVIGDFSLGDEKTPPADHRFMERMFDCWDLAMKDIHFCQDEKREHMMMGLRRVLTRGTLTENDVKIMMGLARQASWAAKNLPEGDQK